MEEILPKLENLIDESRIHSEKLEKGLGAQLTAWLETLSELGLAWAFQKDPRVFRVLLNGSGQEDLGGRGELPKLPELPQGREVLIRSQSLLVWRPGRGQSRPSMETLTPREKEVFSWMTQGKTLRETAIILGISPRTVEKHRENAMRKITAPEEA